MSRKITFLTLFLWLMTVTFPVIAQQKADTTYTFRFVPQKDMFYVPWNGNDPELARLLECIENNKTTILDEMCIRDRASPAWASSSSSPCWPEACSRPSATTAASTSSSPGLSLIHIYHMYKSQSNIFNICSKFRAI